MSDTATDFEAHRASLLALAYRMLGDFGRAEDLVQEAWLRWQRNDDPVDSPKAFLVKVVTRLCLNELSSARARREETRADRLPEPVHLGDLGLERVEILDQISMAFLVLLQRLTPAERAALLLHDVFDFDHDEIATLLQKTEPASRQLLKRAREHVEVERRSLTVSREEHQRLLRAFVIAATTGDVASLKTILADDVVLVADAGPDGGTYGRVKNLPGPLVGREKVAAFVAAVTPQGAEGVSVAEHELNGQPAVVVSRNGQPFTVIMLAVVDGQIRSVFMQADVGRLRRVAMCVKKDVP
jgi:RNA polymerase sigma-70 factor (ECF subfamily)